MNGGIKRLAFQFQEFQYHKGIKGHKGKSWRFKGSTPWKYTIQVLPSECYEVVLLFREFFGSPTHSSKTHVFVNSNIKLDLT